ncbi:hypothetical protein [Sediminicola luteus]|uniref:hypothetical protein n=1 Tax=Sediminicola luteus TaxID=319238 RepID=UPI0011418BC4|nr:hypothetical protein [Sediminicola luteus]
MEWSLPELSNTFTNANDYSKFSKKGTIAGGLKRGFWHYELDGEKFSRIWSVYDNGSIQINYPTSWELKENKDFLFFSRLENRSYDFFLVKRYSISEIGLSLEDYFHSAVIELKEKEANNKTHGLCVKLEFEERDVFYLRFDVKDDDKNNAFYNLYTEHNGFIYDFAMRVGTPPVETDSHLFAEVVFSLKVEGEALFQQNELLNQKEWIVDLDTTETIDTKTH